MTATYDEPRIVEFPALTEARNEYQAKRDRVAAIVREAGPQLDMSLVKSLHGDTQAKVDEIGKLNAELDDLHKKVSDLEQVGRAAGWAADSEDHVESGAQNLGSRGPRSLGDVIVDSEAFKGYRRGAAEGPSAQLNISLKNTLLTTTGIVPETTRGPKFVEMAQRPAPDVVDFIPQTTSSQAAVVWMEETTYTNAAVETLEGGTYPEAALALTEKSSTHRKIAVWLPVTDELLEDVDRAREYINNRLPFMIRQRLDAQVLVGDGVAPNLLGTENVVGINTQALGGDSVMDAVYKGMVTVEETGRANPSVIFIRPSKWTSVRLAQTTDGVYLYGPPNIPGPMTLWGVPVKTTSAAPATKALIGDYANFSELAVRRGIDVQISNSHSDFFINGKQAIRADMRCTMIHYRPSAFTQVTGL